MSTSSSTNVFVYGSLKRGFGNHWTMQRAGGRLIGEFVSTSAQFSMFSLGGYPGVESNRTCRVMGEVYNVPWEGVTGPLDELEGNGVLYTRHVYRFRHVDVEYRGPIIKAWMYTIPERLSNFGQMPYKGFIIDHLKDPYDGWPIHRWVHLKSRKTKQFISLDDLQFGSSDTKDEAKLSS